MNCVMFESFLHDYLDALLEPSDREAVETHLSVCDTCRQEAERLRSLLSQSAALRRMPNRDLWPLISAEISLVRREAASDSPMLSPARSWVSRARRIAWPIAAAIALGILGLVAAVRLVRRPPVSAPPKAATYESGQPGSAAAPVSSIPPKAMEHPKESVSFTSRQTDSGLPSTAPKLERDNRSVSKMGEQFGIKGSAHSSSGTLPRSRSALSGYVLELRVPDDYSILLYLPIGSAPQQSIQDKFWREDEKLPSPGDRLKIRSSSQGESVLLQLSILKGPPGPTVIDERGQVTMLQPTEGSQRPAEEALGSYSIGPGEVLRTVDLQYFNTKPIELRVVIDKPEIPTPLRVINKTSCMAVVNIEEKLGGRYWLTFKNASDRPVLGLVHRSWNSIGFINKAIAPGEVIEIREGFSPTSPHPREVTLNMALFDDGSYEGDLDSLAIFYSKTRLAPRQHAKRMLPLLTEALQSWQT